MAINYGNQHFENKEFEEAITEYKLACGLKPESIEAKEALANIFYHSCMRDNKYCNDAINAYKELQNLQDSSYYLIRISDLHIHLGDYDAANEILDKMETSKNGL